MKKKSPAGIWTERKFDNIFARPRICLLKMVVAEKKKTLKEKAEIRG